jgi:hypothetical protein
LRRGDYIGGDFGDERTKGSFFRTCAAGADIVRFSCAVCKWI